MVENLLTPCKCGCETPVIEVSNSKGFESTYRIICPKCGNGNDGYFVDSLIVCITAWNNYFCKGECHET